LEPGKLSDKYVARKMKTVEETSDFLHLFLAVLVTKVGGEMLLLVYFQTISLVTLQD
jgi:hypothetical protein